MDLVLIRYRCTHAHQTAVPGTVTLNLIACGPSPRSQKHRRASVTAVPSVWAHPKPRTPCDILGGLQSNTHSLGLCSLASNANFPRPGGPFLRRKPSTSALSTPLRTYTTSTCITVLLVVNTCCGRSPRHIPVEEPDTCITFFVSNRQTDILEVPSGFVIVHPDPSLIRGIGLDLVCWSLRLRDQCQEAQTAPYRDGIRCLDQVDCDCGSQLRTVLYYS